MPKFRVEFSTLAMMRGSIEVEADDQTKAEVKAFQKLGNVPWKYEGTCEGENGPQIQDCRELK